MSLSTDTKRIIRWGLINFYRNTTVSITSILMMTVTLMVIGTIIFLNAILGFSLAQIQNKVDVNVYFFPRVAQTRIDEVENMIQQLPEVAHVEYVSEDQVLADFKARHAQDALTLQGLEELGTNPLGGMLNIRAREAGQYESIAKVIDASMSGQSGRSIIYKVNYAQNKQIIERLTDIMHSVQRIGVALTLFFMIISFLITFNTIRLAIYMARDEIVNMRLMGAENKYIQGPFIVEGIVYGAVSSVIALVLFYPITLWLTQNTQVFFEGMSIVKYYSDNFFMLFFILMSVGILLGIISAWFAIRKYLKR